MKTINVEVLSVNRNIDIESGKASSVVAFGNLVDSTPDIKERVTAEGQTAHPDKTIANRAIIFLPDVQTIPYTVGSRWAIQVEDNGEIKISKSEGK